MPNHVRILPDRVANQIAAGEVIERPAAVVKELLENALDAGATRIEVTFAHGGRSHIRIEDNGRGMTRDDALLALERHATSKITEADDLNRLHSFGFRGEALPSIASVSKFTLQTRAATDDTGTEIHINGGTLSHVRDCGRPTGTRIEVAQLFNSVPARRKFLKTDATESAHIITTVRLYALAFPRVSFTLVEDTRHIFRSPENPDLQSRIREIFGRQLADQLIPITAAENNLRLTGLISKPGAARSTRHEMITFINNRPVDSRALNYALIESYAETLPKGRYPIAFLFLELDPATIDVNVHPAKREVRFRNETEIRSFIIRNILKTLRPQITPQNFPAPAATTPPKPTFTYPATPEPTNTNPQPRQPAVTPEGEGGARSPSAPPDATNSLSLPATQSTPANAAAPSDVPQIAKSADGEAAKTGASPDDARNATPTPTPQNPHGAAAPHPQLHPRWRYLNLLHNQYALYETPAGLLIIDRRAAEERIWFERLQTQYREQKTETQKLLLPVPLELPPIESALLLDRLEFFAAHGIEITEFGRNFFRIETIPAWMRPGDAETYIRELVAKLREGSLHSANLNLARETLAKISLKRALRLDKQPTETEMRQLVADLYACQSPLTSPSGNPTQIELTQSDLARRFHR